MIQLVRAEGHGAVIYVDPVMTCIPNGRWRWKRSCHMFVDTRTPIDELHSFADLMGLKRSWFQDKTMPHYDLTERRRRDAVRLGAVELNRRDAVIVLRRWREQRGVEMPAHSK